MVRSLADVKFEADMSKQLRLLWTVVELVIESLGFPPIRIAKLLLLGSDTRDACGATCPTPHLNLRELGGI